MIIVWGPPVSKDSEGVARRGFWTGGKVELN